MSKPQNSKTKTNGSGHSYLPVYTTKAYAVWLFTFSDMKTILLPTSAFGLMYSQCSSLFGIQPPEGPFYFRAILTLFWVWVNLLPFNISNQVQPLAIEEDILNKPWRPMPSRLLSPDEAKQIMSTFYLLATISSSFLGGWKQSFLLIALGYWYNNLDGAGGLFSRNFINGCGFLSFMTGAYEVALGTQIPIYDTLSVWLLLIWFVVFTTVQSQDMADQAGDAVYKRRTLPLVVGDSNARWITTAFMVLWSTLCSFFWQLDVITRITFILLGLLVSIRLVRKRTVEDDKRTFRLWNIWMVFLYSLPFLEFVRKIFAIRMHISWMQTIDQLGAQCWRYIVGLFDSAAPLVLSSLTNILTGITSPASFIQSAGLFISSYIPYTILGTAAHSMQSALVSLFCGTGVLLFVKYFDRFFLDPWASETSESSKAPGLGGTYIHGW